MSFIPILRAIAFLLLNLVQLITLLQSSAYTARRAWSHA